MTTKNIGAVVAVMLLGDAGTARLAADCALVAQAGDLIVLSGEIGTGKSTFARAFIRARAGRADLDVPSPTYTLVQTYDLAVPIAHVDLYRLGDASELDELGLEELGESGIVLIEWPERSPSLFAEADLVVTLGDGPNAESRTARLSLSQSGLARYGRSLTIRDFLTKAGFGDALRAPLSADASARGYEAITPIGSGAAALPMLLMDAPRQPDGPPISDGLPYSRIAHLAEDVTAFVAIDQALRHNGFAAPEILARDLSHGLVLIEHLGLDLIIDAARRPIAERYIASAQVLARMHRCHFDKQIVLAEGVVHTVSDYDRKAMLIEVSLLADWYLPRRIGRRLTNQERAAWFAAWHDVLDGIAGCEINLVLRDHHSPNIIWRGHLQGDDRIGLIDFQDAVFGPSAYDVASLGRDARIDVPDDLEQAVRDAYCAARLEAEPSFDRASFEAAYAVMAAQRNAKILGIFIRLDERDGKPAYLAHLPRIERYFAASLAHPALAPVAHFCGDIGLTFGAP